jgi:hypothetical protein
MSDDAALLRGRNVVVTIDFHEAVIYPTDAAPRQRPERLVAADPEGHFRHLHHHAGNPSGAYEQDSPEYWRGLSDALSPAGAILLLGHGNGKANASHRWVAYAEQHHRDVAAKVVADIRVDIDHLSVQQVLGLAQYYFDAPSG